MRLLQTGPRRKQRCRGSGMAARTVGVFGAIVGAIVAGLRDIAAALMHVLVVPNRHIPSVNEVTGADEDALGRLVSVARRLAHEKGVQASGYRLVINTGPDARQSVFHVHLHLMGGERLFVRPFQSQPGL